MNQIAPLPDSVWRAKSEREIAEFLGLQFAPPSSQAMWEWWEENVYVPDGEYPGEYRSDMTPMVRWIADWLQDVLVKMIILQGAAQTLKTRTLLNFLLWVVKNNPGTTMWVNATIEASREFFLKRLEPAIQNCKPVNDQYSGRIKDMVRFDSMNLLLRGTNSRVGLQGDPVKWMIFDERREWRKGAVDMLRMRTRTMTEFKEISAGVAGMSGSELDADFCAGSQTQGHFKCLDCGHSQPFRFGRGASSLYPQPRESGGLVVLHPDGNVTEFENDFTKPEGAWNWERLKQSVRWQCEKCGALFKDSQKFEMIKTLHPVDHNPTAPPEIKSLTWNAFQFIWRGCNWGILAQSFIKAVEAAKHPDNPNIEPLKTFVTETLGESWKDELGQIHDWGFLEERKESYGFDDPWAEEAERIMAADKQAKGGEHYWWVIRSVSATGRTRLVSYGKCNTLDELEELRKHYKVPISNAIIDSGFKASDVYRFCMATGWKPFKGDDCEFFTAKDKKTGKVYQRIWQKTFVDGLLGLRKAEAVRVRRAAGRMGPVSRMIPLYRWSNPTTKDLLAAAMRGQVGWTIPKCIGQDYMQQVTAETRVERMDTKGRVFYEWRQIRADNHLNDCELMIHVALVIKRRISAGKLDGGEAGF